MNNIDIGRIITSIGLVGLAILLAVVEVYASVINYTGISFYRLNIIWTTFKLPFLIVALIIGYGGYILVVEFLDYIRD